MRKSSFVSTLTGSDSGEPSSPIGNPDSARLSVGQGHGPSIDGYQGHSQRTSITIAAPSSPGRGSSFDAADASSSGKHGKGQKGKSDTDAAEEGRKEKEWEEREWQIVLDSDKPGAEADMGPFPVQLSALATCRPKEAEFGGRKGSKGKWRPRAPAFFSADLGAHATHADRQRVYGQNMLPMHASKNLLLLMWLVLNDKVLVLLSIAAVVSLALGLFQDFGTQHPTFSCGNGQTCTQPPVDWVEGVAIIVAIVIVVVGSMNDWQDEKQFKKLNEKKEDHTVKIIRDGAEKVINVKDVVVGDIALLEPGEVVPCDGVFPTGHNVNCDESGMTGESNAMKNVPARRERRTVPKVLESAGSYVVIAVSIKSFNGRIMMDVSRSVHPRSSANRTCDTNRTSGHLERPPNPLSFIPLDFVWLESSSFSSFGSNPLRLAGILSIWSESLVLRSSGLVASPFGSNLSSFVPQDSYDSDPLRSAGFLSVRFEPLVRRSSGLVRQGSPSFGPNPLRSAQPSFIRQGSLPFGPNPLRSAWSSFVRQGSPLFGPNPLRSAWSSFVQTNPLGSELQTTGCQTEGLD
ncbi:E1-E2 ATPase-domain-containing protein [Phellopilus nigrolimitatus]|nr:E1-E2 ATPase-domain-containing protein [Phellopilus nigrolimitatus]